MGLLVKKVVIAVDGFSSCGKSTFAKKVAKQWGLLYIDSGAMYRAVTLKCLRQNIIQGEKVAEEKIKDILEKIHVDILQNAETGDYETYLNGENVENAIRDVDVSCKVSVVSALPDVRHKLVELQRKMASEKSVIMDGRDIGTVVFPKADLKIFMTADEDTRAKRRYNEMIEKGIDVRLEDVKKNIRDRDFLDQNRAVSPLKKANDALVLDNSRMTMEEEIDWLENQFRNFNLI